MAVEDESLDRGRGVALRGGDALDDRLEDLGNPGAVLGAREDHLLARDRQDVLELLDDRVGIGRRKVDLVEHRDQRQVLAEREVDVGERLRFDALGRIDDEDRAFACLEAVADLIREVDVPRGVDQVQAVGQPILRRVLETDGAGLDRDALLALEVHRIEDLARHLAPVDRVGQLEQPIREGRFAVVDVRDDREVAEAILADRPGWRGGHEAGV